MHRTHEDAACTLHSALRGLPLYGFTCPHSLSATLGPCISQSWPRAFLTLVSSSGVLAGTTPLEGGQRARAPEAPVSARVQMHPVAPRLAALLVHRDRHHALLVGHVSQLRRRRDAAQHGLVLGDHLLLPPKAVALEPHCGTRDACARRKTAGLGSALAN